MDLGTIGAKIFSWLKDSGQKVASAKNQEDHWKESEKRMVGDQGPFV